MKGLLIFLLGALCGAFGWHLYLENQSHYSPLTDVPHAMRSDAGSAMDKTKDAAGNMTDSINDKLRDWKLTPEDIKSDLAKTGQVVRSKTAVAGEKIADARILTVIKAKYVLDRELSALEINVDCQDGRVALRGTVASADLIAKAVALALDTNGVIGVTSTLAVK
jgi:osmotically-inducible protein OsmY